MYSIAPNTRNEVESHIRSTRCGLQLWLIHRIELLFTFRFYPYLSKVTIYSYLIKFAELLNSEGEKRSKNLHHIYCFSIWILILDHTLIKSKNKNTIEESKIFHQRNSSQAKHFDLFIATYRLVLPAPLNNHVCVKKSTKESLKG